MKKTLDWFDRLFTGACILIILIMTTLVILSVALRYLFKVSFIAMDELILYSFIATTFLGPALCVKNNENIRIDNILKKMPLKLQQIIEIILNMLVILLQVVLIKTSNNWITIVGNVITPGFQIQLKYLYALLPVSAGLVTFYQIREIVRIINSFGKQQTETDYKPAIGG